MMRSLQSGKKDLQYESQSQSLSETEQQDIREVKKVRENNEDVDNEIVNEVTAVKSNAKRVNTPSKLKAAEKLPKTPTNPLVEDNSSAPAKEVERSYKRMQFF